MGQYDWKRFKRLFVLQSVSHAYSYTVLNKIFGNRGKSRYHDQQLFQNKDIILVFKLLKNEDSEFNKKNLLQLLINAEGSLTEKENESGITELNKKLTIDVNINLRLYFFLVRSLNLYVE